MGPRPNFWQRLHSLMWNLPSYKLVSLRHIARYSLNQAAIEDSRDAHYLEDYHNWCWYHYCK